MVKQGIGYRSFTFSYGIPNLNLNVRNDGPGVLSDKILVRTSASHRVSWDVDKRSNRFALNKLQWNLPQFW